MDKTNFSFLKTLTEAPAPSGYEDAVREIIIEKIKDHVDSLSVDKLGNLIAVMGTGSDFVISAHMDEVGFMATKICDDGSIKFSPIGGISAENLPSKRVFFPKSNTFGVIGAKPVHLNRNKKEKVTFSDLYIDVGTETKSETEDIVSLGDFAVFDTKTELVTKNTIKGKAIDDRLGCFLLCNLITNGKVNNCTVLCSVQEETGLAGASAFANKYHFPYAIALDVTTPNDLPSVSSPETVCKIGGGPVISFADRRCIYDNKLISDVFSLLNENGILCQTKTLRAGGNEAGAFQQDGLGMKAISISIPCRFIHGPVGIFSTFDLQETERAVLCIASKFKEWEGSKC